MSKLIEMVGKRFGRLVVIERAENTKQGKARWKCQCDCGNIIITDGSKLRNGSTKSCGCYQKERTSEACRVDLTGQTIGNFTVLGYCQKNELDMKNSKWKCKCNLCGNITYLNASNLKKQISCGCTTHSKGEARIKNILELNKVKYIQEKRFSNCTFDNGKMARFDFYLPDYNIIIEYDGIQHFKQGTGYYDNEEKFLLTQNHDYIKNEYCKKNNITLIRIPYTHYDNIILEDLLYNSKYIVI